MREAVVQGADGAEVDAHLTRDGEVVVIHGPDTVRTAGKKLVVKESTLSELRALDVGGWKDPAIAGEKLPLLDEVLAVVPAGARTLPRVRASEFCRDRGPWTTRAGRYLPGRLS